MEQKFIMMEILYQRVILKVILYGFQDINIKFLKKIKFYIYIKPFLDNVTNEDTEEYKHLAQKYDLDIVVGNRFQFQSLEGNCINVGKNEMYEDEQSKIEDFINSLKGTNKIYRHSIEPIKEMLNGDKPQTI